jgi:uncharacterized protein
VTLYVDASAVLKIYLDEPETSAAEAVLTGRRWMTGRHTYVEIRRNLVRVLVESPLEEARRRFESDWESVDVIDIGASVATAAAALAERTGLRTLDALHLGAAQSAGGSDGFVTFDRRLADAARSLGLRVLPE